ncbi:efflux RND transporter permease subunit [Oceanospirillum linum]|uniref:MFS transporter n=1 Tax=Oceanospirillum linum TaxID=966 RepID=A0A1T1HCF1_OCELI|nr:efflux RND transporter permease subunit [Oceanospirillum linum]OOV87476.1 MFS transporter [Oceanospirillum linum]SEF89194.1 Multidrug efflux pump subunit AcrB [Oleiphilus messinensis]SMP13643.1 Multidrug efflux pump subunit AcrB [Oceanospirillum linum]
MSIAKYFIEKKVSSWMITLILLIGGVISFAKLGQLEDPEFTIKDALIITYYPGATPEQVEEEVTYPIEQAIQNLPYVDKLVSTSKAGYSKVQLTVKDTYRGKELNQIWDELRKKMRDLSPSLPKGTSGPNVVDDFGDVYGVLLAVTGEGYRYNDLKSYVDFLRRDLVLVDGVSKVAIAGQQQEQIFIEISRARLSALGITVTQLDQLLSSQNTVSNAGRVKVGSEYIRISTTGEFEDISALENLLLPSATGDTVYLSDVADVRRGYKDPASHKVDFNGQRALLLGVSFASGVNVVDIGKSLEARIEELKYQQPAGIELNTIYFQSHEVDKSVSSFLLNLFEAVGIVILVLLVFMGVRSGILIGLILLLTILGTFIVMQYLGINLQRISLGGLIIALGMLVDNAIVVTEGVLIGLKRGHSKLKAAEDVVKQTKWPLLGATIIAIVAFAPIGLSPDSVGEFVGSLFQVLLISLFLSWITAITLTPFFCDLFFKEEVKEDHELEDPYKGILFTGYKWLLSRALHYRKTTVLVLVASLMTAGWAFQFVKQAFFPPSTTPLFFVTMEMPEGSHISDTYDRVQDVQNFILKDDRVLYASSTTGQGMLRFMLTYSVAQANTSYSQIVVRAKNGGDIPDMIASVHEYLKANHSDLDFKLERLMLGPASGSKLEARFIGPDPEVLRQLSVKAKTIFAEDGGIEGIKDNWRQRVKVLRPVFDESHARRLGITKKDIDRVLLMNFSGAQVGVYREGTRQIPIIMQPPAQERLTIDQMHDLQVYSQATKNYVPLSSLVSDFKVVWEDPIIERRNRKRSITVMGDPLIMGTETTDSVFRRIRPQVEAIELPRGYSLEWGGEYENSRDAQQNIFSSLPMGYLFMFIITVLLFNSFKASIVIWLCVPLALIGVSQGLLIMDAAFSFMALLGFLSLSGMIVKNGIVLLDQINYELSKGVDPYEAVFHSAVSRVRPVCMAAITTILGMVPLLFDAFFEGMAVVISFGLGFATLLTLIAVPVFYAMFFRIPYKPHPKMNVV